MVDVSQYTGLITSEHSDKPKFSAMVSAVAQCFVDQQNALGNFIPSFDLDQAVGDQLDTLGAWVGIGRRVRTPLTGVYFSFDIAGVGFDQGVWQGEFDPSTGITVLDDDTYRLLIRAKIGANHWDGTLASSAAILNLIFQGGTAPQHLTATNELFAIGDGATGAFQLKVGGIAVYSNINVASIYRNDWQGNQLLYSTPRTNYLPNSMFAGSAIGSTLPTGWAIDGGGAGLTWAVSGFGTDSGGPYLELHVTGTATNTTSIFRNQTPNPVGAAGEIWTSSASARLIAGTNTSRGTVISTCEATGSFPGNNQTLPLGTPYASASSTLTVSQSGSIPMQLRIILLLTLGEVVNCTFRLRAPQLEKSSVPTSFIATSSGAVTITDYTAGSTGIVSMGQKPVSGAQLTWNGSGDAYPGGTQVFIEDHQDMSISFGVAGKLPSALFLALLSGGYIPIKPEGVRVRDYVTTSVDGQPIFGMDMENQFVSGFDVGAWGTPLQ